VGCAGKTVRSLENACHTSQECFRGVFTTRRYTNIHLPLPYLIDLIGLIMFVAVMYVCMCMYFYLYHCIFTVVFFKLLVSMCN